MAKCVFLEIEFGKIGFRSNFKFAKFEITVQWVLIATLPWIVSK